MHTQVFFVSLPYTYTKPHKYILPSFCIANQVFCYKIELAHIMLKIDLFTHATLLTGMLFLFALSKFLQKLH